jgi:hypothetical protein
MSRIMDTFKTSFNIYELYDASQLKNTSAGKPLPLINSGS